MSISGQNHVQFCGMTQQTAILNARWQQRLTPVEHLGHSNLCLKMSLEYVRVQVLKGCVRPKVLPQEVPFRLVCSWRLQRLLGDA